MKTYNEMNIHEIADILLQLRDHYICISTRKEKVFQIHGVQVQSGRITLIAKDLGIYYKDMSMGMGDILHVIYRCIGEGLLYIAADGKVEQVRGVNQTIPIYFNTTIPPEEISTPAPITSLLEHLCTQEVLENYVMRCSSKKACWMLKQLIQHHTIGVRGEKWQHVEHVTRRETGEIELIFEESDDNS